MACKYNGKQQLKSSVKCSSETNKWMMLSRHRRYIYEAWTRANKSARQQAKSMRCCASTYIFLKDVLSTFLWQPTCTICGICFAIFYKLPLAKDTIKWKAVQRTGMKLIPSLSNNSCEKRLGDLALFSAENMPLVWKDRNDSLVGCVYR